MLLWAIITIILAGVLWVAWTVIKTIYKNCIVKPINYISNSNTARTIKAEKEAKLNKIFASHGKAYEYTCIYYPKEYAGDPRVPGILANYKSLLNGDILDPKMIHAPSETLIDPETKESETNDDYLTYLEGQTKALKRAKLVSEAMTSEYKRVSKLFRENGIIRDFRTELLDQGLPIIYLESAVTTERMQTYKPGDWKDLIEAVASYEEVFDRFSIDEYLKTIQDKKTLIDEDKMRIFDTLYTVEEIDPQLIKTYLNDDPKEDIYELVAELNDIKNDKGVSSTKAFNIFLESKRQAGEAERLRESYKKAVRA